MIGSPTLDETSGASRERTGKNRQAVDLDVGLANGIGATDARPQASACVLSNYAAAGSLKPHVSSEWRVQAAARGTPVRIGRVRRAALLCLLVAGVVGPLAGCGGEPSKRAPEGGGQAEESGEEAAAERQEEAAEAAKNRELLSVLEAKKREEAAEAQAKKTERLAAAKAKKREQTAEKEVKKREAVAAAKVKKEEEASKAAVDKQREATEKREAEVKKQEAERVATQQLTTTAPPPSTTEAAPR